MPQIFSSSKAMTGMFRAVIMEDKQSTHGDGCYSIYIPALHKDQMPFKNINNLREGLDFSKIAMKPGDYPVAEMCVWEYLIPLDCGDVVLLMFENGDSEFPVIMGHIGTVIGDIHHSGGTSNYNNNQSGGVWAESWNTADNAQVSSAGVGDSVDIPEGYGTYTSVMGYHLITAVSQQLKLKNESKTAGRYSVNSKNWAMIDGRYLIATTANIGGVFPIAVGDYLDVTFRDGSVYQCISGDIKRTSDTGANSWGHDGGRCVTELIYDHYWPGMPPNPGWPRVARITKVGGYWGGVTTTASGGGSASGGSSSNGEGIGGGGGSSPSGSGVVGSGGAAQARQALSWAMGKIGCSYSQANRDGPNSYDCSSLCYYAYKSVGITIGTWTGAQKSSGVSIGTNYMNALPGDLGLCNNWGHVVMFTDSNGNYVHAGNPSSGVCTGSYYKTFNDIRRICP